MSGRKPGLLASLLAALSLAPAAMAAAPGESLLDDNDSLSRYLQTLPTPPMSRDLETYQDRTPADRWALPMVNDHYGDSARRIIYLDQGWTPKLSMLYYFTDQGSQLIDYDLFVNIEQADSRDLFNHPVNHARYRYLPQKASPQNPDALPVGFLQRKASGKQWLSVTCGACHTSQINYQGTGMRIDGAGAQADFVSFLDALRGALKANLNDSAKFDRLARRMLGRNVSKTRMDYLRSRLQHDIDYLDEYFSVNQTPLVDGHARVDAIGRIYNQVLTAVHSDDRLTPDAPVSYPFLWDAPHHDYVQWLGLTPNAGPGALGRNAGEVLGVFGEIEVRRHKLKVSKLTGYKSSVESDNLVDYEKWLWRLQSPQWPQHVLPKINQDMAAKGRAIYVNQCVSCHRDIRRDDPDRKVYAQMYGLEVVGTDPKEIQNALRSADTGILKGTLVGVSSYEKYGDTTAVAAMLSDLVYGTLLHNVTASLRAAHHAKEWGLGLEAPLKQGQYPDDPKQPNDSLAAYKARPLNGIWATAPYLHNGSVPTLHDLLLPGEQRPVTFAVGQLEYDPLKVGYKHDAADPQAPFVFDTRLTGNSNQGHEFGTHLDEEQRMQLLEYIKTL